MGWAGSNRRERLPRDWRRRRAAVLARDGHQCCHIRSDTGERCTEQATDVDHIRPGDDHSLDNLQSLCAWHHAKKTASEAADARARRPRLSRKRPPGEHPGAL